MVKTVASSTTADHIYLRLDHIYFIGVLVLLSIGGLLVGRVVYVFFSNYKKLNSLVKSYLSVIIPDIFMVINFWPRDVYNLYLGRLDDGPWCQASAFVAMMSITALNSGAVCVAYSTFKVVKGEPMSDNAVLIWNVCSWIVGAILGAIFLSTDSLGPYSGIYCCVKNEEWRTYVIIITIIVVFTAVSFMSINYYRSYRMIKQLELRRASIAPSGAAGGGAKASETVMKQGMLLVCVFYGCWTIMIGAGLANLSGFRVHAGVDAIGAWLAKLQPIIDSVILLYMLDKIISKSKEKAAVHDDQRHRASIAGGSQRRGSASAVVPMNDAQRLLKGGGKEAHVVNMNAAA